MPLRDWITHRIARFLMEPIGEYEQCGRFFRDNAEGWGHDARDEVTLGFEGTGESGAGLGKFFPQARPTHGIWRRANL